MKNSYKLLIATAIFMIPMATVFALSNTERENQFILLGNLEGQEVQLANANNQLRAQIVDIQAQIEANSTMWQTIESQRKSLHDSLFQ